AAERLQQAPPPPGAASTPQKAVTTGSPAETSGPISDKDLLLQPEGAKNPAGESSQIKRVTVVEIKQEFLPVMLTQVNGKKAKIKPVDGEEYDVSIGDQLKGLDYRVTDVEVRNTEDKDGNPVDDSVVKLRNIKSGLTVDLIKGVPAQEHAA